MNQEDQVGLRLSVKDRAKFSQETKAAAEDVEKIGTAAERAEKKAVSFTTKLNKVGKKMVSTGKAMTLGVTLPILAAGRAAFKASGSFESAFAGVRKTVDATQKQYNKLSTGIREMAKKIPASVEEISAVAEAAGQLGIKRKSIMGFTRTMIDLGNSTNMASDQAATSLARFANIVQMPQRNFDKLGSTIVELGNNLATTEAEITEMGLRIAGAGKQVNMSEAEILAFGAALSSVGIRAEAGGTAISTVMVKMAQKIGEGGEQLGILAKISGETSADFKKQWETDSAGAIISFIEGLGKMKKEGGDVFGTLDKLGFGNIRMRDALLRASGAGNLFRKSQKLANEEWKKNNALTKEAAERYKTTDSRMKVMANRLNDVKIIVGDLLTPAVVTFTDWVTRLAEKFQGLDKDTQKQILKFLAIAAAVGPLLIVFGKLIIGISNVTKALKVMNAVALLNPWTLLIAATILLVVVIWKNWDKITAKLSKVWAWISKAGSKIWTGIQKATGEFLGWLVDRWADWLSFFFMIARNIVGAAAKAFGWIPGIGDKIKAARDDFDRFTDGIVDGLRDQADKFRRWGDDVSTVLERARRDWEKFDNAVGKTTSLGGAFSYAPPSLKGTGAPATKKKDGGRGSAPANVPQGRITVPETEGGSLRGLGGDTIDMSGMVINEAGDAEVTYRAVRRALEKRKAGTG